MVQQNTTSLIILQPTPFCNINCSYCYLPMRNDRATLTIENLQRIFEKLVTFPTISGQVTVVWHAGEPLVLGVKYYRDAFSCIQKLCPNNLKIVHAFQTNGMLINDEWCDLFQQWDVGVGVSIDGPRHINDAARRTRSGRGTFEKTVAGIKCLQKRNIAFYVISVLTKLAALAPDAVFALYEELDIHDVGINIEEQEGIHKTSTLSRDFDEDSMIRYFARISELMKERQFPIAIRELEETVISIRYLRKEGPINNLIIPFGIITIDVQGEVFTFSPELAGYAGDGFQSFSIGNIFRNSFDELARSPVLERMTAQINRGVGMCRTECKYFPVCGGGAPSNKLFENGTFASTETMHCRLTKKRVADFVLQAIEERLLGQFPATKSHAIFESAAAIRTRAPRGG